LSDGMEKEALAKNHTTTGQAVEIGVKCKVWRTILTHFSPRFAKVSDITEATIANKVLVTFDHMRVGISQLEWAYRATELYSKLLSNEDQK
jgi:ribonuclease Z